MNSNKNFLTFNNLSVFFLGIYPAVLSVGTFASEVLNIIIIFLFLANVKKEEIINIIKNKIFIFCIIIWLYLIINLLFSNYFYQSFSRAIFFFRFILLLISIVFLLTKIREQLSNVIFFWLISFSFIYFDLFFQYIFNKNLFGQISPWPGRLSGIMGSELKIGHLILGFVPLIVGYYYQNKKYILCLALIFITLLILLVINERGNTLRFIIFFSLLFLFIKKFNLKFKFFFYIIILISFFIIISSTKGDYSIKQRYLSEPLAAFSGKSFFEGLKQTTYGAHYFTAIKIFKNYPIFGSGIKTFRLECSKIIYDDKSLAANWQRCSTHPHQIYFEILSELGILGFFLFFGFFFIIIYKKILDFFKKKDYQSLSATLYVLIVFLPLIPSGSFFTSFAATIFWINFSFMLSDFNE